MDMERLSLVVNRKILLVKPFYCEQLNCLKLPKQRHVRELLPEGQSQSTLKNEAYLSSSLISQLCVTKCCSGNRYCIKSSSLFLSSFRPNMAWLLLLLSSLLLVIHAVYCVWLLFLPTYAERERKSSECCTFHAFTDDGNQTRAQQQQMLYPLLLCLKALVYLIRTIFKSRKRTTGNHSGPLAPSTTSVLSKHCSEQISSHNSFATKTEETTTTAAASEHEQRLSPSLHQVRHQSAAQLDRK